MVALMPCFKPSAAGVCGCCCYFDEEKKKRYIYIRPLPTFFFPFPLRLPNYPVTDLPKPPEHAEANSACLRSFARSLARSHNITNRAGGGRGATRGEAKRLAQKMSVVILKGGERVSAVGPAKRQKMDVVDGVTVKKNVERPPINIVTQSPSVSTADLSLRCISLFSNSPFFFLRSPFVISSFFIP